MVGARGRASEDGWAATDPNGTIIAHALVSPDGEGKLKSWGMVHPEHREASTRDRSWIPELSEPLRDDISMRETGLRPLVHESENGAGERCPECAGFNRADVRIVESSKGLG